MNTPAHVLLGAAAFGQSDNRRVMVAAILGALAPDASLYIMAGVSLFLMQIPPSVVFGQLYYSQEWQTVFAIDNSIFVWLSGLALALWRSAPAGTAFAAAGLLHIALDFPLHAGDGRAHFWPLSNWIFDSPVSYWDSAHHAMWVAPVSVALCLAAYVVLWRKGIGWPGRIGFGALMIAELWVARQWILFF